MKRRSKLLSILLSLALVVSMIPAFGATVYAAVPLQTPQGGWNGTCIQWAAVPGATDYSISLMTKNPNDIMGGFDLLADIMYLKTDGTFTNRINSEYIHNPDPWKVEYDENTGMFLIDCTNLITVTTNKYFSYVHAYDETKTFQASEALYLPEINGQELLDGHQSDDILKMGITAYAPTHVTLGTFSVLETPLSSKPFGIVNTGRKVRVFETQGMLSRINYGSGFGWIRSDFLEPIKPMATHVVKANALRVRNGPGTDYPSLGGLTAGREVEVVETSGEWSKIIYGSVYGWAMNQYLEPIQKQVNPFVDVFENDEYYDAVLWAYYHDPFITNGTDAKHFGPKKTVKRGEAVTFLWRAMGKPKPSSYGNPFKDVKSDDYFYEPVLWAVEKGITNGTSATTFSPDETLTTAHIITFLYRTKTGKANQGWYEEAANWAGNSYGGKPFGVNTVVNNSTDCPRGYVVMFLKETESM